MKKTLTAFMAITGMTLVNPAAIAQEYEGCFMLDRNGNVINLPSLCPPEPTFVPPSSTTGNAGSYQAVIKRRDGGIPVIDVVFNGDQTFEMMVDTGASGTVITPAMATALGVKPEGSIMVSTPSDNAVSFPIGRVGSISAGGIVTNEVTIAISNSLEIGLLGQDFFGEYDVTIKRDVIEFQPR